MDTHTTNNELSIAEDLRELSQLVNVFLQSGVFQDTKTVAAGIVKVLAGRELGLSPFVAMRDINIIKGKTTLAAGQVGAMIKGSGKYDYYVRKQTADVCEIEFAQKVDGKLTVIGTSTFTMQDASKAGLTRRGTDQNGKEQPSMYDKFGRNMLFARAMTNGARWYCPDIFNGPIYTPDELRGGDPVETQPPPAQSGYTVAKIVPVNELGNEASADDLRDIRVRKHEAAKQGMSESAIDDAFKDDEDD